MQQKNNVIGKVTDSQNNEPVHGANVTVKGTNIGAITDSEGSYTLSLADQNATLVFPLSGTSPRRFH